MLIATDATEHQDFEHSQLVERHSSSADARAHAGAQPGSKRQRASPLASRGELLAIHSSAWSLGFRLGFQPWVQPPPTPAAASSGAAAFAPPRAPRFAAFSMEKRGGVHSRMMCVRLVKRFSKRCDFGCPFFTIAQSIS